MNLYQLRYFTTLAQEEHYTKAAEILSITQPSLSHAIASLEKELGKLCGRLSQPAQGFLKKREEMLF